MAQITIDTKDLEKNGTGIKTAVVDDQLIIVVDLKAKPWRSAGGTGKMDLIASTGGFREVFENWKLNLMVGKKAE
jgi:hypothetical protein